MDDDLPQRERHSVGHYNYLEVQGHMRLLLTGVMDRRQNKQAGIYQVNIKVSDVNGVSAFLQVIALANGKVDGAAAAAANADNGAQAPAQTKVLWIPAAISTALLIPAFFLGRRSQIVSLRHKMMK